MRFRTWIQDDSGFSLVEVMMAVAILALVTLPIINYFTYSSVQTIDGRERQTATMAAEDVMEELKAYSNHDQIARLIMTPDPAATPTPDPDPFATPTAAPASATPAVTMDPDEVWLEDTAPLARYTASPSASPAPIDIMRYVKVNNSKYLAKVHFDFDTYDSDTKTVSGSAVSAEYNDYYVPNPTEVYAADTNVVADEDDEVDTAVSSMYTDLVATKTDVPVVTPPAMAGPTTDTYVVRVYYRYQFDYASNSVTDKDSIKNALSRMICVHIRDKNDEVPPIVSAPGAGIIQKEVTLVETEIKKSRLKNIFVFYKPAWDAANTEHFQVTFGSGIGEDAIKKMNFFFTYQQVNGVTPPGESDIGTYTLKMNESPMASFANFYSNLNRPSYPDNSISVDGFTLQKSDEGKWDSYVSKKRKRRIGKIYVDIFNPDDTAFEKVLAHLESTFAE